MKRLMDLYWDYKIFCIRVRLAAVMRQFARSRGR